MSTIGLRNQDEPNKNPAAPPENPAYPSGISPSRTTKTPDNYALRTILAGKVSFVSAHVTEGMPINHANGSVYTKHDTSPGARPRNEEPRYITYGIQRTWVVTFDKRVTGRAADYLGKQTFAHCVTTKGFNQRYTKECKEAGIKLIDHPQLVTEARNSNAYGKINVQRGCSRLIILYLEPVTDVLDGFAVQALRLEDNSLPIQFAYAQAIIGRKLEQLSYEQEQRYNQALENSKASRSVEWKAWESLSILTQNQRVNDMLKEFNGGTTLGSIR